MTNSAHRLIEAALVAMVGISAPLSAQDVRLVDVPGSLRQVQQDALNARRAPLAAQVHSLNGRIDAYNASCGQTASESCRSQASQLESERVSLIAPKRAFNEAVAEALETRIEQLRNQVDMDERRLSEGRLGFQTRGDDIAAWESLASEAKTSLEKDVWDELSSRLISTARTNALRIVGSLSPPKANAMITGLRAAGINDSQLFAAIRAVASTPGKAQAARDLADMLDRFDDLRKASKEEQEGQHLQACASVLGILVNDAPQLKALITDIDLTTSAVYNNITRRVSLSQVDLITTLNERQLHNVNRLAKLLRAHVDTLQTARRDQAALLNRQQ